MSGCLEKQDTTQTFSTNHDKGQLYRYLVGHNQDQDRQNIPETDPKVVIRGSESCFCRIGDDDIPQTPGQ